MKISTAIVDYFRKGPVLDKSESVDFAEINKLAVQRGWLIHPDCCNKLVKTWLCTMTANYNATFYKEWHDVISKSRFELFIDQIMQHTHDYILVYQMKPGLTSEATLYNGYTDTMEKMLRRLDLDLYYLEHRSLWFDAKLLVKTFIFIVFGKKF
jgi:hypothetical protein